MIYNIINATIIDLPDFYVSDHLIISHPVFDKEIKIHWFDCESIKDITKLMTFPIGSKIALTLDVSEKGNKLLKFYKKIPINIIKVLTFRKEKYEKLIYCIFNYEEGILHDYDNLHEYLNELSKYDNHPRYCVEYKVKYNA